MRKFSHLNDKHELCLLSTWAAKRAQSTNMRFELIDLEWLEGVSHLDCVWVHRLRQHITHTPRVTLQVANICHCLPVWQLVHAWPVCPSSQTLHTLYIQYLHYIYTIYTIYIRYILQTAAMTVFYGVTLSAGLETLLNWAVELKTCCYLWRKYWNLLGHLHDDLS